MDLKQVQAVIEMGMMTQTAQYAEEIKRDGNHDRSLLVTIPFMKGVVFNAHIEMGDGDQTVSVVQNGKVYYKVVYSVFTATDVHDAVYLCGKIIHRLINKVEE